MSDGTDPRAEDFVPINVKCPRCGVVTAKDNVVCPICGAVVNDFADEDQDAPTTEE